MNQITCLHLNPLSIVNAALERNLNEKPWQNGIVIGHEMDMDILDGGCSAIIGEEVHILTVSARSGLHADRRLLFEF
jgi:hypothetical protein